MVGWAITRGALAVDSSVQVSALSADCCYQASGQPGQPDLPPMYRADQEKGRRLGKSNALVGFNSGTSEDDFSSEMNKSSLYQRVYSKQSKNKPCHSLVQIINYIYNH